MSDDFGSYKVIAFRPAGTKERIVKRDYEHRVRSKAEMELMRPAAVMGRNSRARCTEGKVGPTDRDIMQLFPGEKGRLFVLSSRGRIR